MSDNIYGFLYNYGWAIIITIIVFVSLLLMNFSSPEITVNSCSDFSEIDNCNITCDCTITCNNVGLKEYGVVSGGILDL